MREALIRLATCIGIAAATASAAFAQARPDYQFPQKIGPAELIGVEDFEAKDPGMGKAGRYKFQGWTMGVYVYDKKRSDIAPASNPAQAKAELDTAAGELIEVKRLGHYTRLDEGTAFAIPPTQPIFWCRAFTAQLAAKAGAAQQPAFDTYTCVTTSKQRFVKLRITSTTPAGDQATVFTPVAAAIELFGRQLQR